MISMMTILLVITASIGFYVVGYVYGLMAGIAKCQKIYDKYFW